jgi:hypothetical protein
MTNPKWEISSFTPTKVMLLSDPEKINMLSLLPDLPEFTLKNSRLTLPK